jgi:hypothetical protein
MLGPLSHGIVVNVELRLLPQFSLSRSLCCRAFRSQMHIDCPSAE